MKNANEKTGFSLLARLSILAMGICGICICACWYPFEISLNAFGGGTTSLMWAQLCFDWLVSLPCFLILGIAWTVAISMKKEIFTRKNSDRLKLCGWILLCDTLIYLLGNLAFMLMEQNVFAIFHFFMALLALIVSLLFFMAGYYVSHGTRLREENEEFV